MTVYCIISYYTLFTSGVHHFLSNPFHASHWSDTHRTVSHLQKSFTKPTDFNQSPWWAGRPCQRLQYDSVSTFPVFEHFGMSRYVTFAFMEFWKVCRMRLAAGSKFPVLLIPIPNESSEGNQTSKQPEIPHDLHVWKRHYLSHRTCNCFHFFQSFWHGVVYPKVFKTWFSWFEGNQKQPTIFKILKSTGLLQKKPAK